MARLRHRLRHGQAGQGLDLERGQEPEGRRLHVQPDRVHLLAHQPWTESAATRTDVALPTFSGGDPIKLDGQQPDLRHLRPGERGADPGGRPHLHEKVFDLMTDRVVDRRLQERHPRPAATGQLPLRHVLQLQVGRHLGHPEVHPLLGRRSAGPRQGRHHLPAGREPGHIPTPEPDLARQRPEGADRRPDETIDAIAFAELGDASKWRLLAAYNRIDNPLRLRPGQRIMIPRGRGARMVGSAPALRAGIKIKVDGSEPQSLQLIEVVVEQSVHLPDMCVLRLYDLGDLGPADQGDLLRPDRRLDLPDRGRASRSSSATAIRSRRSSRARSRPSSSRRPSWPCRS